MSKVKELFETLEEQVSIIAENKEKAIAGKKSSSARVRKATMAITRIGKELRAATIAQEKIN